MKSPVKALIFSTFLVLGALLYSNPARSAGVEDTVRRVTVDKEGYCSAVAIAPDRAVTARHCLQRNMQVDGKPVESFRGTVDSTDAVVLTVPGLACPCAPLALLRPLPGTRVFVVGFPVNAERTAQGDKRTTAWSTVKVVADINTVMPWAADTPFGGAVMIVTSEAIAEHGDSGGGLFNSSGELVGITSIGVTATPSTFFAPQPEVGSGFVPAWLVAPLNR